MALTKSRFALSRSLLDIVGQSLAATPLPPWKAQDERLQPSKKTDEMPRSVLSESPGLQRGSARPDPGVARQRRFLSP